MKVLVLSLHRLGDLQMHRLLLRHLKFLNPHWQLGLVVNDSVARVQKNYLIGEVDQVFSFPRETLQNLLADETSPMGKAFEFVNSWMETLENSFDYSLVFNATPSRLAHHFVKVCQARRLASKSQTQSTFSALDLVISPAENLEKKHLLDVICDKWGLPRLQKSATHSAPPKRVLVQSLSSETEKDCPPQLLKPFLEMKTPWTVEILSAPWEKQKLEKDFPYSKVTSLTWSELEHYFRPGDVVVSVDTSIAHAAVLAQVPVISLVFETEKFFHFAPFQDNGKIIVRPQNGEKLRDEILDRMAELERSAYERSRNISSLFSNRGFQSSSPENP